MAQQKYQPFQKLNEYFDDLDHEKVKFRKIGSKKFVYNSGDANNHIYFVLSGEVLLHFNDVVVTIPPLSVVGDFQLSNELSTRISSLAAYQKAYIAILPLSYFSKIKKQKVANQNFIKTYLQTDNTKLCYSMIKCFSHRVLFRSEELIAEHEDKKSDLILIKDGHFTVKKYIGVGVIEKFKIEVEKQFALIKVGEGELVKQNIICDSPRGEVFICKDYYVKMISKEFGQKAEHIFKSSQQKLESHQERYKIIKNLCIKNIEFASSILPSVLQSPKSLKKLKGNELKNKSLLSVRLFKDKKQCLTEPSQRQSFEYKNNYYQINRSRENEIISVPTNSNLSLVPLVKLRRPSMPVSQKKELPFLQYFKSKIRKPNIVLEKPEEIEDTETIPQIFRNRFQKKMFYKANNPFHHYHKTEQDPERKETKLEVRREREREKKLFFI